MITLSNFECTNLSTGRKWYDMNIVGNVGEKIKFSFDYLLSAPPSSFSDYADGTLEYVLKPKSAAPYPAGSPVFIPYSFFNNLHNLAPDFVSTKFTPGISNTAVDKKGSIVDIANSEIFPSGVEIEFYILPALTKDDFVGGVFNIPSYFSGTECLTLYYQLRIVDTGDGIIPHFEDDTSQTDLHNYLTLSSVGYFKEAYNLGLEYFQLTSFTAPASYDPTLLQSFGATVTRTASALATPIVAYSVTSKVQVMLLKLKDSGSWDATKTYMQNTEFTVLEALADGVAVSNALFSMLTVNIVSATEIDVTFDIQANKLTAGEEYAIWFNIGVENADGIWITQNTEPKLITGEQGSSLDTFTGEIFFSHWDLDPPAPLFTGLRSFRSDDGVAYFQLTNTQPILNVIQSFTFGFKNKTTNIPLASELFTVPITALPYTQTRGRVRNSANLRNVINFSEISPNNYQLEYGFQAWDGWADANDIVFFCAINVVSNGISDIVEFQSPFIEVGQFATTKNSAAEPQALPLSVEFFVSDAAGNVLIPTAFDNPIAGENHLIVATWQDNNLNDLQTTDVIGYLGVCAGTLKTDRSRWRYFFSEYDPESDTPFRAPLGHTSNRSKAEVVAIDKATVSAVLIWDDYVRIFGENPACFDFRLDKKDPPAPAYATQKYLIWHFRNDQDYCEITLTEPIGFIAQFSFNGFLGSPPTGTLFKINGTTLPYSAFLLALPTLIIGDVLSIYVQTSSATPYGTDWIFTLLVGTFSAVAAGYKDYEIQFVNPDIAQPNVGCDAMMGLDEKVEFNPDINAHDSLYVDFSINPPNYDNYTIFRYFLKDASDIALLNAGIAALPLGTKYALRFWAGHTGMTKFPNAGWSPLTAGNMNRKFSYRFIDFDDTREILAYRGETSQPRYAFKLGGDGAIGNQVNALKYDGVSTYQKLNGVPPSVFAKGKKLVIHGSIYVPTGYFNGCILNIGNQNSGTGNIFFSINYNNSGPNNTLQFWWRKSGLNVLVDAPIKLNSWNTYTFIYNGGNLFDPSSFKFIVNGLDATLHRPFGTEPPTFVMPPSATNETYLGVGSPIVIQDRLKNGTKMKIFSLWAGASLPLPTAIELRTMFNDKGTGNSPYTEGEPYDPLPSAEFYMKVDFGKAGVAPITVDSSVPIAVLMQGATSYANFLNP